MDIKMILWHIRGTRSLKFQKVLLTRGFLAMVRIPSSLQNYFKRYQNLENHSVFEVFLFLALFRIEQSWVSEI